MVSTPKAYSPNVDALPKLLDPEREQKRVQSIKEQQAFEREQKEKNNKLWEEYKMEFKKVDEMPTAFKELSGKKKELKELLEGLTIGEVVEITPEEGKTGKQKMHTVKSVAKRVEANFKFRTINDKVYVQRLEGGEEKEVQGEEKKQTE